MKSILLTLTVLAAHPFALAQSTEEAAKAILAQNLIRTKFTAASGRVLTFETDLRKNSTLFIGSSSSCYRGVVPTRAHYAQERIVLSFTPAIAGCDHVQYRINPLTGAGEIFASTDGGTTWTPSTTGATIALAR